jgi:hypothetical protein
VGGKVAEGGTVATGAGGGASVAVAPAGGGGDGMDGCLGEWREAGHLPGL